MSHMEIYRTDHKYFDDLANYLISFVSLTLTMELYVSGDADKYAPKHGAVLDAKQAGMRLTFYPGTLLDDIFAFKWPTVLSFEEELIHIDPGEVLDLGALERPLYALETSMFVNYFVRHQPDVEAKFGNDTTAWPDNWNFGRIVRNSFVHGGSVHFRNPDAQPVHWRGLTYSPTDNGRKVMNGDLWAADLIYLMMDMDSHVKGPQSTGTVSGTVS